jgi:two-component system, NtrC family, sensor kinase
MRRHDKAGGTPVKAQHRKMLRRRNTAKVARRRRPSTADATDRIALLTIERDEALEQQRATADVLKVISRSTFDLQTVLDTLVESAAKLCAADLGLIFQQDGDVLRLVANCGVSREAERYWLEHPVPVGRGSASGRALLEGRAIHIPDVLADPEYRATRYQELAGYRSTLGVPLLRDGTKIGVFGLGRREPNPFTERQIELVTTFADQAVIAIENARLFDEVQARTRELSEALIYQTGSANILRVIASSPTDVAPVLKSIVESACELCEAYDAVVMLRDDDELSLGAHHGPIPMSQQRWSNDRTSISGRAMADRRPVHVQDVLSDEGVDFAIAREMSRVDGCRTLLGAPLLREGESIGAIVLRRTEVSPFSDKQINLLQTFGDQAVIAIENARLFDEVQAKTRDLEESLQQQTATADVLKVINRSAFDLEAVFNAVSKSAMELCAADAAGLFLCEGDVLRARGVWGMNDEFTKLLRDNPVRINMESHMGRAVLTGRVANIADFAQSSTKLRKFYDFRPFNSFLAVPLMRDAQALGVFTINRDEAGGFTDREVQLVKTFADQAAIAVENARLFDEVQAKTRELSKSLDDLRAAQDRLVQTEKLASLGQLTAGIAHEIKNPLNFVNNFSALSVELTDELNGVLKKAALANSVRAEVDELTDMLKGNLDKVVQHGKRADSIVRNMLLHSRSGSGEHRAVEINGIVEESLNLAYHGARAEGRDFNITLERDFDPAVGFADIYPQEITRVLLNLLSNGFYAATKHAAAAGGFEPKLEAATRDLGDNVEIRIRDNGMGIPSEVREMIFNPFFTTKPAGEGTGLGLSMSHDIVVKQHGGKIDVVTEPGSFTEFIITLPRVMPA